MPTNPPTPDQHRRPLDMTVPRDGTGQWPASPRSMTLPPSSATTTPHASAHRPACMRWPAVLHPTQAARWQLHPGSACAVPGVRPLAAPSTRTMTAARTTRVPGETAQNGPDR